MGYVFLVVVLCIVLEMLRELTHFRITRYTVRSKKLSGLERGIRIVFLSDLHNRSYGKDNEKLYRAIREEEPDLILIGGDMLVGREDAKYKKAIRLVSSLVELCPVIYANGNHEQRMKEEPENYHFLYEKYKKGLLEKGVRFLENESCQVEAGRTILKISGLELPMKTFKKFQRPPVSEEEITQLLQFSPDQEREAGFYQILLAHNPAYAKEYLSWGADLVLSGHLHGGMARIPGVGGVITPQGFLFPKYSGEMTQEGEKTVIVSKGLGTHTFHIRFLNQPEVVTIRLKKPL